MRMGRREKRTVISGAAWMLCLGGPAWAQIPVTDAANLANTTRQVVQGVQQIQQLTQQLSVMQQQYSQLIQTYQALSHLPDEALQQLAAQLNVQQFRTPLPSSGSLVGGLMNGTGLDQLGALGQQILNQNRLYAPSGTDFAARQLTGTANSIAGVQAMLNNLYQSASGRVTALQGLEGQLASAQDTKAVADLSARVQTESTYLQAQQVQAQVLQTWQAAQVRNETQQSREQRRCYIDQVLVQVAANSGGGSGSGASGCSQGVAAPGDGTPAGITGNGTMTASAGSGDGAALGKMMAQDWGSTAASNATAMGVNPSALAATCVIESGCKNVGGQGSVSGAFQMTDSTYTADINKALQANPSLAGSAVSGLAGKMDPGTQSIAAAQELKTAAQGLQSAGIANPTVLDTRGYYNFGARYGATLAQASDTQTMAALMPTYTSAQLAANGISSTTTVGQWRQSVTAKMGTAATQPVLRS